MALFETLLTGLLGGVSAGLTLGVSQFVSEEYVKPWLHKIKQGEKSFRNKLVTKK